MKILHLLPAALETLLIVYRFNACHFCTVDVNNEKNRRNKTPDHTREVKNDLTNQKALFDAVIRPGPPRSCFCTKLRPCSVVFGERLAD